LGMPGHFKPFTNLMGFIAMKVAVIRKAHFNAAHRLHNPSWDEQKNKEVFGLCNNPNYHGHNYELEVKVAGEIDPETGMVVDLGWLADLIREKIERRFDHKNLNVDTEEFRTLNPTAENICLVIWNILRAELPEKYDLHIRLYETPRNFVECPV
jgi:6-pyruvoyltetrahydropterin/6-carboxytetrahydropterin synthase